MDNFDLLNDINKYYSRKDYTKLDCYNKFITPGNNGETNINIKINVPKRQPFQ